MHHPCCYVRRPWQMHQIEPTIKGGLQAWGLDETETISTKKLLGISSERKSPAFICSFMFIVDSIKRGTSLNVMIRGQLWSSTSNVTRSVPVSWSIGYRLESGAIILPWRKILNYILYISLWCTRPFSYTSLICLLMSYSTESISSSTAQGIRKLQSRGCDNYLLNDWCYFDSPISSRVKCMILHGKLLSPTSLIWFLFDRSYTIV